MRSQRELPMALRAAYLALHRATDSRLAPLGVTADQFVLLASLSQGQALTQRELAERMSSDPSTVRAMLVLLENAGLIERQPHPEDGRAKTVALSAAGKRKFQQLWKQGQQIRDRMYEALRPHEVDCFIDMLGRISAALHEADSSTAKRRTSSANAG